MTSPRPNQLSRQLARFSGLPAVLRPGLTSFLLGQVVPMVGTARLHFEEVSSQRVVVTIRNRRKVQNHIKGVHAAAMTLLAETATGMVVGMNVRDDCLPLAKELRVAFKRRAQGALRAVATLTDEQRTLMQQSDKGEVTVAVQVSDESGAQPIECEFIWAWVPASKSKTSAPAAPAATPQR